MADSGYFDRAVGKAQVFGYSFITIDSVIGLSRSAGKEPS